ncbi:unnamed protein product, partial [Allacma fusca]
IPTIHKNMEMYNSKGISSSALPINNTLLMEELQP